MIKMAEKFKCPVCQEEYNDSITAFKCAEKNGYPKIKFKIDQRVNCYFKDTLIEGTIISITCSKPSTTHRKPHTVIYGIQTEKIDNEILQIKGATTASEDEIMLLSDNK